VGRKKGRVRGKGERGGVEGKRGGEGGGKASGTGIHRVPGISLRTGRRRKERRREIEK